MKSVRFLLLLLALTSCKTASIPQPFVEPPPVPLNIKLSSDVPMAGTEVRVTCQLPRDVGEGIFSFGILEMFTSSGPIDRLQIIRIVNTPCAPFRIFCSYKEYGKKPEMVIRDVTPSGECRATR